MLRGNMDSPMLGCAPMQGTGAMTRASSYVCPVLKAVYKVWSPCIVKPPLPACWASARAAAEAAVVTPTAAPC